MASLVALLLLCYLAGSQATPDVAEHYNPDVDLTTPQLIAKYGYPSESHTVVTEDGYILTLHRIPWGRKSTVKVNRSPVLIQHGLLSQSSDWVILGPNSSLAYILADAGYDVWLGNARGNTWSRRHTTLNPSNATFWEFSWHEMGVYDLPAVIDYILERTGQEKLFYVGHSQGTTMFYVMASEKPEYNDKIRAMFGLAPVAYLSHTKNSLLNLLATVGDQLGWLAKMIGINEFLPRTDLYPLIGQALCEEEAFTHEICTNIMFYIFGFDTEWFSTTIAQVIMGHDPAGAPTRSFLHYAQVIKTDKFRKFNYGILKNLAIYGSLVPPKYRLNKITSPVALMYGMSDTLAPPEDVALLKDELLNVISYYRIQDETFNHADFIWATRAKSQLYDEILRLMKNY